MNFSRAAARLGMGQPLLTKSIQRLESTLGVQLLDRSHRQVRLTAAGGAFAREARQALLHADLAEQLARKAHAGERAQVRVAYVMPAMFDLLPRAIGELRRLRPDAQVQLEELPGPEQIERLLSGQLDIALLRPEEEMPHGLRLEVVARSRFVAAVPSRWPQAQQASIGLHALAALPLIVPTRPASPRLYDSLYGACAATGVAPRFHQEARSVIARMCLVACELGVALVSETMQSVQMEGVTLVPIDGLPDDVCVTVAAAWHPELLGKDAAALLAICRAG